MHKMECCAFLAESLAPTKPTLPVSFWGAAPATDMIKLDKNEGVDYNGELRLLFSGG